MIKNTLLALGNNRDKIDMKGGICLDIYSAKIEKLH